MVQTAIALSLKKRKKEKEVSSLAVVQEVEQSSPNRKVGGSISGPCSLLVELSEGKILSPRLLVMAVPSVFDYV